MPYSEDLKSHEWIAPRKLGITEYKDKYILPQLELQRVSFNKAILIRARNSILLYAIYIYAVLIMLMLAYLG